jgi:hypothetical protein
MYKKRRSPFIDVLLILGMLLLALWILPIVPTKKGKGGITLQKVEFITGSEWLSTH